MTIEKKNPNATSVAAAQGSNVFTAINDRVNREESANHGMLAIAVDSTSESLTSAQFWEAVFFLLSAGSPAPGGGVTLTVPAEERGLFVVRNNCGQTVTVTISGQSVTAPTVATGATGLFTSDGVNVYGL